MTRIAPINPESASGKTAELFKTAKNKMGMIPNIFRAFAHSPAVLEMYMQQSQTLAQGALSPLFREQIALTVAGSNQCNYCASAHTALAKSTGANTDELQRNLSGQSEDPETQAGLSFAKAIVEQRGHISDRALEEVRAAGFSEQEIVEIIAHIGLNTFTNYFNHIAEPEIDFPKVRANGVAHAA